MSPLLKLKAFAPQLGMIGLGVVASSAATVIHAPWALVPVVALAGVSCLLGLITAAAKASDIDSDDDWERLSGGCQRCSRLKLELEQTRRALVELRP